MPKTLTHAFVSAVADGTDATLVRPSNWNADHNLWYGYRTVTTTTDTVANSDHLSLVTYNSGVAVAVSLPAPAGGNMPSGWKTTLRNIASGVVTISGTGGATINGLASITLNIRDTVELFSVGTVAYFGILTRGSPLTGGVIQVFTVTGTYTPSAGMVFAILECIGPGGGGGGTAGTTATAGSIMCSGGGGGGSYSRSLRTAAQIGASQAVTVGPVGTAGAASGTNGGAGGAVSIGTLCVANGGGAGIGLTTAVTGTDSALGGARGTGDFTTAGNPGCAPSGIVYAQGIAVSGVGAAGPFGGAGRTPTCAHGTAAAGTPGLAYGGGGSGGVSIESTAGAAGGAGGPGVAIITEFISV
jgi:hypothetical protein